MSNRRLTERCVNCNGKGHVLDAFMVFLLPVFGAILAPFETRDPNGFTRQRCQKCNGSGRTYIED